MLLTYDDYTIGWIAALPYELAPAQALLDEEHDSLEGLPGDNNTYTLGRMGKHNVVIAALPVMGTNAAAKVAKDLIRTFQNVRFGLMVGIGGGVPTGPEDVRLGDIVVSTQQGRLGGVLQYDFGTEMQCDTDGDPEQDDDFVIKSFLREPHTSLQTAVANLRSKFLIDGYGYHNIYEEMLEKKPRMKETFKKPTTDVLYRPEYVHRAGAGNDCSVCDTSQVIDRPSRNESTVHYGLIGSGNQVIRNAVLRDKLYRKEKIICFEMEAAGLMKDFECMVIRGICDYCDSHKNKDWQPYAAAVAAAYAKELLSVLPVQQVKAMPRSVILDTINSDLRDITVQTTKIITAQQSSEFRKALEWIAAPDPETNFRDAQRRKDPETGTWIADSKVYVQWKNGLTRHIWLYGKAGCGKSVLTTTAIPDIRQHCTAKNDGFAMFYFSFSDLGKQSWQDCLKSLVVQLVSRGSAPSMLVQNHQASKGPPTEDFLRKVLLTALESYDRVFIVLDALDESPTDTEGDETIRGILLEKLVSLAANAPNIKFFLTSQDLPDIRSNMEVLNVSSAPMAAECVNRDIKTYVANQLAKDKKLSRLNDKTKNDIETTLTAKADGMFRWAYCQLHQLKTLPMMRPKDVERALRSLPRTLDETYERMLKGIDEDLQEEAFTLLRWLAYAQRPLSLREIAETITIDLNQKDGIVDTDNRPQPGDVINLLAGLVVVRNKSIEEAKEEKSSDESDLASRIQEDFQHLHIQLAHFSVKEYLESTRSSSLPFHLVVDHDQHFLSNCCLVYLMQYARSEIKTGTEQDLVTFPLLHYAAESWFKHYVDTGDPRLPLDFLRSRKALDSWRYVYDIHNQWREPFETKLYTDPTSQLLDLYMASYLGLCTVVKALIDLGADVNTSRGKKGSALAAACAGGHNQTVEILLAAGANPNEDDNRFDRNALYYASEQGNLQIIRMLMKAGVDHSAQHPRYRRCMSEAVSYRGHQAVKYLIDAAVDLDIKGGHLDEVLVNTAYQGVDIPFMKMLIDDYGIDPKAPCVEYGNALIAVAFGSNSEDMIKVLIKDYGIDINFNSQFGGFATALQAAAYSHHTNGKITKTLLDIGTVSNAQSISSSGSGAKGNLTVTFQEVIRVIGVIAGKRVITP